MDLLDKKLPIEMKTFNGKFAKSTLEKECLESLERDGLAASAQNQLPEGVRIQPPSRFHLTALSRDGVASLESEK